MERDIGNHKHGVRSALIRVPNEDGISCIIRIILSLEASLSQIKLNAQ